MCGLCGAFGGSEHWADGLGTGTPPAERQARAAAANRLLALYGLKLSPWGGRFTLSSATGRTAVVDHFGQLWLEAERLAGRPCDPLDPHVIETLESSP